MRRALPITYRRVLAYGYRESESEKIPQFDGKDFLDSAGKIVEMADTFVLKKAIFNDADTRPVVACSLGVHVEGAALPHVDPSDTRTAATGAMFRFCRKIPNANKPRPGFRRFVRRWLKKNLVPLSLDADTSFEAWIVKTPYTETRKNELREKWKRLNIEYDDYSLANGTNVNRDSVKRLFALSSFVKDENYPTFKHARGINSRSDEFKCLVGPIFQLISDQLFKLPWFIKKIPINDRPQYIIDLLQRVGEEYTCTDYTSYEAHFEGEMMQDCEMLLYEYMVQFLPIGPWFMEIITKAFFQDANIIKFKKFIISIFGKRMSGEMNTSLGNGFSNLMFMLYLCKKNGNKKVRGVIEGDDGLFVMIGSPPNERDFANFGLNIKMITEKELSHASFCGMVFDMHDRTNVTNPIDELVSFGWTTRRYAQSRRGVHMCLLRSKALSLAYQYRACPVLSTLAYKICELTASYDVKSFVKKQANHYLNSYELEITNQAFDYFSKNSLLQAPGINTRNLVETLYGLTVQDQIEIEKYISGWRDLQPIRSPILDKYIQPDWHHYFQTYTIPLSVNLPIDSLNLAFPQVRKKAPLELITRKIA
jgi:hypothetical protein